MTNHPPPPWRLSGLALSKTYGLPLRILTDIGHPPTSEQTAEILRRAQNVVLARMVPPRPVIVLALSLRPDLR